MHTRITIARLTAFIAAALFAAACQEPVGPVRGAPRRISAAAVGPVAPGTSIVLDQHNGTLFESGTVLAKGFNPTNPHVGDAIVATFFWTGSTNTITAVTDFVTDANHTLVGNTYQLVEYVTSGGYSMATYVATNVQGFPDPNPNPTVVLAVQATFTSPVTDGGVMLSAWSGVDAVSTQPVGAHRSAAGTGSTTTIADPGAIAVGAGALAYGVTMSNGLVGRDPPPGYSNITIMSDNVMVSEGDYLVGSAVGSADPRWTWGFNAPSTWLATVLALNPPLHLVFTAQPSTTLPLTTMAPVRVTALDASGNVVTTYSGPVTIAIGHNGGLLAPGTLSGTRTATAVNGVASFSDLSIDQVGNGYTLVVSAGGVVGAESAPFNIGAF